MEASNLRPDDLLSLCFVRGAKLAPGGAWAAYSVSSTPAVDEPERCEIRLINLNTREHRSIAASGGFASDPSWSPDGANLAFIVRDASGGQLCIHSLETSETRTLVARGHDVQGIPAWTPDGRRIAFCSLTRPAPRRMRRITGKVFRADGVGFTEGIRQDILAVSVDDGEIIPLVTGKGVCTQPAWSPCGTRLLYLASAQTATFANETSGLYVLSLKERISTAVATAGWFIGTAAWSPDGERIVIIGDLDSPLTVPSTKLWTVDVHSLRPEHRTPTLTGNVGLRVHHDMPIWGIEPGALVVERDCAWVSVQASGRCGLWRIALDGPECCEEVIGGDRSCILAGADATAERLLYIVTDLNTPTDIYTARMDGSGEQRLTELNIAAMSTWPSLQVEHLTFSSTDGLELEGWWVARADTSGPQRTVLFIHGGPFLATGHAFRFDFHLLASNGIAVLFSNFRGSTGYGDAFVRSIMNDWGERGFPDHMAAVDCALGRKLADPAKLGVWGASHGGFATAWIVGHTQRFAAAVAEAAAINFATMHYLSDITDFLLPDVRGRPHEVPDVYRSRSPLSYAHRATTPTLMLHGEHDYRCPLAEAEQFYRALQDVGCPSELVIIADCSHMGDSLGPLPARVAQNEALLEWFERWL